MGLKNYRPTTPSLRWTIISDFKEITKSYPEKSLLKPLKKSGGRNCHGRITAYRHSGGHKRMYRVIDFKRDKFDALGKVIAIEYDPNRTSRIALIEYPDKERRYIIAPSGIRLGDEVLSSRNPIDIKIGNCMPLRHIPLGTSIHNIELSKGKGGQIIRAAGSSAQLMAKEGDYAHIKLTSGETRLVAIDCFATLGQVSNPDNKAMSIGKAGRSNWLGRHPRSRGVVRNPVDHPHGGGEGKSGQGNPHPVSRWGMPTKGYKTRKKQKYSDKYILKHRK
ncbi:MAG: 50S ribosomal protein L2 [Candidatus Omnitrophota bacterium]